MQVAQYSEAHAWEEEFTECGRSHHWRRESWVEVGRSAGGAPVGSQLHSPPFPVKLQIAGSCNLSSQLQFSPGGRETGETGTHEHVHLLPAASPPWPHPLCSASTHKTGPGTMVPTPANRWAPGIDLSCWMFFVHLKITYILQLLGVMFLLVSHQLLRGESY